MIFDPDWTYIEPGKETEFALTGFINDQMVGGVNMIVVRKLDRFFLSAHAGYAAPLSVFADYYNPGFALFADIGYNFTPRISIVGLVGYNCFKAKGNAPAAVDDTHWINLNVNVQYRLPVSNRLSTYLRGGVGYYIPDAGDRKIGGNTGLGILYHCNNTISLGVGVDYHQILEGMDVYKLNPPPSEENIQFYILHAGVILNF